MTNDTMHNTDAQVTEQLYSGGLVDAVKLVQAGLAKPFDFTLALGMSGEPVLFLYIS